MFKWPILNTTFGRLSTLVHSDMTQKNADLHAQGVTLGTGGAYGGEKKKLLFPVRV